MKEKIREILEIVKAKCEERDWKYHILPVVEYSKLLARRLNSDEEIAELAALLHDIAWIESMENDPEHETIGIPIAEKMLKELGFPEEIIEEIKHCVASHRGSSGTPPKTITAKIIANADAMSHFDNIPYLIQIGLKNNNNDLEKAVKWVYEKIERNWDKKLTLPEAREMMEEKYKAIKIVLGSMK